MKEKKFVYLSNTGVVDETWKLKDVTLLENGNS